ncbi:hypothetical protein SAMN05421881_104410 [Nitrosomonas halophila]|uniref:Uncharacterized protein n=1 Tax=Nitrosomonas halophila TaxID=44576 RepID=A0A1H3KZW4_9PROT|nr:hypothetical protein SAMN05421881_104410 [Nitrosomonas halophila]
MIEKSRSGSFVLATIAILGQPPSQMAVLLEPSILIHPNHSIQMSLHSGLIVYDPPAAMAQRSATLLRPSRMLATAPKADFG